MVAVLRGGKPAYQLAEEARRRARLEAGMRIDAEIVNSVPLGVDTQAQLDKAREILANR